MENQTGLNHPDRPSQTETATAAPSAGAVPGGTVSTTDEHATRRVLETAALGKIGGWEVDTRTGRHTWSGEVYRIHEVDRSFEPTTESGLAFFTPESQRVYREALQRACDDAEPFDLDLEMLTAMGTRRLVHVVGVPEPEHGKVRGYFQDITQRQRKNAPLQARTRLAEFALGHSLDEVLRRTVDEAVGLTTSAFGFFHFAEDGERETRVPGRTRSTVFKVTSGTGDGWRYPEERAEAWAASLRRRPFVIHHDELGSAGRPVLEFAKGYLTRELVVPIVRANRVVALLGVGNKGSEYDAMDMAAVGQIAELAWEIVVSKRAEEDQRRSVERYRTLFDLAADGIAILSVDGSIITANDAFRRLHGTFGDSSTRGERRAHGMEDRFLSADRLARLRAGEAMTFETEYRRRDGRALALEVSAQLIQIGPTAFIQCFYRDITARRDEEARHRQAHRMEGVAHLAGGMAHEFNNILAAMMLSLSLVRTTDLDAVAREMVETMETLSRRAAKLIRQLLAFSRRSVMRPLSMCWAEAVARQLPALRELLGPDVEIESECSPLTGPVQADKAMLEQVLVELALNARDAMQGRGTIRLELRQIQIPATPPHSRALVRPAGTYVRLAIKDTGCGMDERVRERLFEPFFTTKDIGQATGLGLATVRGIVEQHRGWIEVETSPGAGSTFLVFLPAAAPPPSATAHPGVPLPLPTVAGSPDPSQAKDRGVILLVEDDRVVRKATAAVLARHGYVVLEADSGPEAIEVWKERQSDIALLFTDMVMPGDLSGLELSRRFQSEKPGLRTILTSGYHLSGMREDQGLQTAGVHFLQKPAAPDVLLALVAQCLQRA